MSIRVKNYLKSDKPNLFIIETPTGRIFRRKGGSPHRLPAKFDDTGKLIAPAMTFHHGGTPAYSDGKAWASLG